jgi:hypothetical protein
MHGTYLFAGTHSGVFISENNGVTWAKVSTLLTNTYVEDLIESGDNLFAGTPGGVFRSIDIGASWVPMNVGLTYPAVLDLHPNGTNLFAGTFGGGVAISIDSGAHWSPINTGLGSVVVPSLTVSGTNLFAGAGGRGVWRRPMSEIVSSVERLPLDVPQQFALDQNYPNPFNPSTTIRYGLSSPGRVTIKIFNALGQNIAELVNGEKESGWYEAVWNANVASGLYFYRIEIIGRQHRFADVKKMVLMR